MFDVAQILPIASIFSWFFFGIKIVIHLSFFIYSGHGSCIAVCLVLFELCLCLCVCECVTLMRLCLLSIFLYLFFSCASFPKSKATHWRSPSGVVRVDKIV